MNVENAECLRNAEQEKLAPQPVFVEQPANDLPTALLWGLGGVLALVVCYVFKGIAAFWFRFGIPGAFLATGMTACVFIYRYGMNLARERGEI